MPFTTPPALGPSARPAPERSPLEPEASFSRRLKKWRMDNAKWEGQKKALLALDAAQTEITPPSKDPRLLPG